jgi:hypothetical protein
MGGREKETETDRERGREREDTKIDTEMTMSTQLKPLSDSAFQEFEKKSAKGEEMKVE